MTRAEIALLLGMAAARDNRRVDEAMVAAWHEDLGDLTLAEARDGLRRHYQHSTERVMPAHIRQHVRVIREEQRRRRPHEALALPSRYERDPARDARARAGAALCREALRPLLKRRAATQAADQRQMSQSDLIHARALERARAEKGGW